MCQLFHGNFGYFSSGYVSRGKLTASNKEWIDKKFDRGPIKLPHPKNHYADFLNSIRTRKPAIAHVDAAHRAATTGHLGQVAMETGRTLKWDAKKEVIVGDDAANKMLHPELRKPYKL